MSKIVKPGEQNTRSGVSPRSGTAPPVKYRWKPGQSGNPFLLSVTSWTKGYESAYWLTFRQAKERGGGPFFLPCTTLRKQRRQTHESSTALAHRLSVCANFGVEVVRMWRSLVSVLSEATDPEMAQPFGT